MAKQLGDVGVTAAVENIPIGMWLMYSSSTLAFMYSLMYLSSTLAFMHLLVCIP